MHDNIDDLIKQLKKTQAQLATAESKNVLLNQRVEQAHQEWMSALDTLEDPIFIHDKDFRILRCNQAYREQAGLPYSKIIGRPYYDVFPKTHTPLHNCLSDMENSPYKGNDETIQIGEFCYHSRAYVIRDDNKNYLYSVHVLENVTEQIKNRRLLQENEEKFHTITSTAQDAILIMDDKGKITYWNEAATHIFGYTEEEAIGKLLHPLLAPTRFQEAHKKAFKNFIKTGEGLYVGKTIELSALKKDGTEFPIELSLSAHKKEGKWEAIGIIRDISERKKAEISLQQAQAFSERLVETAPVIIMVMDTKGKIVRFNHYMETLSGYTLDEVKGADWFSTFLPKQERKKIKALFLSAVDDIQTKGEVNTILIKDGSQRQIEWYDKTLKDEEGKTTGLLSIGMDVTERKAAEEELKLFHTLLDHSNDAIEVLDGETLQLIDVNHAACRILGYTREELLSMNICDIDTEISELKLAKIKKTVRNEGSIIFESIHRHKNGTIFPVEVSISLVVHTAKEYAVAVVRDITERKAAEKQLANVNRALRTLSAGNMTLVQAQDEDMLLRSVPNVIVKEGGYALAVVDYAQDDREKSIIPMSWSSAEETEPSLKRLSWSETAKNQMPVSKAIRTATTQITHNIEAESEYTSWRDAALCLGYAASIALPLMEGDKAFGALIIYASEANAFVEKEEVHLLEELAGDLAYGILSLRIRASHERQEAILRDSLEQSIQTIAATVESRDPYTAGHQRRVSELATAIATQMGLSEDQVNGIHLAAIIHDLGKINIPAEILSKPVKLTDIEFMLIKTHPQSGYDIIKNIKFPWPIADIILQHHEKINGSGYPQGLKGDQILLEAKIITVADVVEAISAHRPYRAALGIEAALEEIKKNSGIFYEPAVVDACVKVFEEKKFIFSSHFS